MTNGKAEPVPAKHSWFEDAQAIATGTLIAALGVEFFRQAHLGTGGNAGVAFLIHYVTGFGIGPVLFCLNLPFYAFGWIALGREFTLKTFVAVGLLAAESMLMPQFFAIGFAAPWLSAFFGGVLMGLGILILMRHHSSLGGTGILAAFVQEKLGWSAGRFQLYIDFAILGASFFVLEWHKVMLSVFGAVILNMVLAVNHKPGRYTGY